MAKIPVIRKAKVSKNVLGKYKIEFPCPACKASLKSVREDVGIADECPTCGSGFVLHTDIMMYVEAEEAEANRLKQRKEKERSEREVQRKPNEEQLRQYEEQLEIEKQQREKALSDGIDRADRLKNNYPKLSANLGHIETIAKVLLFLGLLAFTVVIAVGLVSYDQNETEEKILIFGSAFVCLIVGYLNYLCLMLVAELSRVLVDKFTEIEENTRN